MFKVTRIALAAVLFGLKAIAHGVQGLGCPGSTNSNAAVPTAQDVLDEGWKLIAWTQGTGGQFDANTNLHPDSSYGTAPADLNNFPSTQSDFQIQYRDMLDTSGNGNEILFITGDHTVWGYMHWESYFPLQVVAPFNQLTSTGPGSCCSGGNVQWYACEGDGNGIQRNCGHILYRTHESYYEDPWFSIAHGDHFAGSSQNLMVWGEMNSGAHLTLKNSHGGMKVYIRPRMPAPPVDINNIGICSTINNPPNANCKSAFEVNLGDTFSINNGSSDPDGDAISTTQSVESFTSDGDVGVQQVQLVVTDSNGDSATCSTSVTVFKPPAWTPVYGYGSGCNDDAVPCGIPMSEASFNEIWATSSNLILRWECFDCDPALRGSDIYYKRYDADDDLGFDLLKVILEHWTDGSEAGCRNTLGAHFNIFSSYNDALYDRNPWTYCNYNDNGVGFPRGCGETGYIGNWQMICVNRNTGALTRSSARQNWVLSVETGGVRVESTISNPPKAGCNTYSPSKKPTQYPTERPTVSPTKSPTTSPTSQPSESSLPSYQPSNKPSDRPSLMRSDRPSSITETVVSPGSFSTNKNICDMNADERTAFTTAAITSLEGVACTGSSDCSATMEYNCGSSRQRNLALSSRELQQQDYWQVSYEITQEYVCELGDCSSANDIATAVTIANNAISSLSTAFANNSFTAILSQNIAAIPASPLSASLTICLVVWGLSIMGTSSAAVSTASLSGGTGIFYPDWSSESTETCLEDGNEPLYMKKNSAGYLYDNLEACCQRYFGGWNFNRCMGTQGTGVWYVDHLRGKCSRDCEEGSGQACGGLVAGGLEQNLYANPRDCCEDNLYWIQIDFCEAVSLESDCYGGTGHFYRGDAADADVCVQDCSSSSGNPACGGIVADTYIRLYETPAQCCDEQYSWIDSDLCVARTTHATVDKYWPDMSNSICVKDSDEPAGLSASLYDSVSECCKNGIGWLTEGECVAASDDNVLYQGTDQYYIDWLKMQCVKDCEGAAPCGGPAARFNNLYGTASECCEHLLWNKDKDCVYA